MDVINDGTIYLAATIHSGLIADPNLSMPAEGKGWAGAASLQQGLEHYNQKTEYLCLYKGIWGSPFPHSYDRVNRMFAPFRCSMA